MITIRLRAKTERTKRRHRRLETKHHPHTMPHTPEPKTNEVQTAQAVDPAAICSALNTAIGDERWTGKIEDLRPEAHARHGKIVVKFYADYLGVTVCWWPRDNSIRVWAVNPTFLPGIDKTNWDESTHCHRLSATFYISAALRVINDYSLPKLRP